MSEITLKELPSDWEWTTMEQIAEVVGGGTPKSKESRFFEGGNIPWITPADLSGYKDKYISRGSRNITEEGLNSSSARLMPEGTVIFTSRAPIGYVAITTNEISTSQGFKSFVIKDKDISSDYVYWWLKGNKQLAESFASGTTFLELSSSKAKKLPIPIAPPEQQKRIVAKIEELFSHIDSGIKALQKARQLLKQYRQSVLKAAVTGELTKEWREANKGKLEPASQLLQRILKERRRKWEEQQLEKFKVKGKVPKDDKWKEKYKEALSIKKWNFLDELPESWLWVSVDQIGNLQDQVVLTGPFGSNLGKKDFTSNGVPVLTIGCLQEFGIDLSKAMYVREKKADELKRYQLKEGDLLFSRMAAVGRVGNVTKELAGSLFNYHIMRLRLLSHAMLQEFFVSYIRGSFQIYDYVKEVNHGATRDGINTQQLSEMPVALAPPQEQQEICGIVDDKLNYIRHLENNIAIQLTKAKKGKQSILDSAFSGRIT